MFPTHHSTLLKRYQHLRQVGTELNNRLVRTLSRDVIHEGGHKIRHPER